MSNEARAGAQVIGDPGKINLTTSSFHRIIENNCLYVDKTKFIEHFITSVDDIQLITRQRRLGKSLNMNTLQCFLTDQEDSRDLFQGLYIENSSVWEQVNQWPCFLFDFKDLNETKYKYQIFLQVSKYLQRLANNNQLSQYSLQAIQRYLVLEEDDGLGLALLVDSAFEATGKQSYILIDEYDRLLMMKRNSDQYETIQDYLSAILSSIFKGNDRVKKGLMTGVTRISHEDMLSGLNNLETYDVFSDEIYTTDYGYTEEEINVLGQLQDFDKAQLRAWYNGIQINGTPIYNTYAVMKYLKKKKFGNYWGNSGTLDLIRSMLTSERRLCLLDLVNKQEIQVPTNERISLRCLEDDAAFYSLLIQAGYLSVIDTLESGNLLVNIPNTELLYAWKEFILSGTNRRTMLTTMLDNVDDLVKLARDIEKYLSDSLSYHDIGIQLDDNKVKDGSKTKEIIYHVFVLGLLGAYRDSDYKEAISNRESGDDRFDIRFERPKINYLFEFKSCTEDDDLEKVAMIALTQINEMRYYADLPPDKILIKIGAAFCGKTCKVVCERHVFE
jgi:hypothetical protein